MATAILLVRHAAHAHLGRVLTGRMPGVPLSEQGRGQARALAARLRREAVAAVYTSPCERAAETADIIAEGLGLQAARSPSFDEIDFGAWTGQAFDTLAADPRWARWNARRSDERPPAGESMDEAGARARLEITRLRAAHAERCIVVVSHADVIKAVVLAQLGLTPDAHDRITISAASISRLALWDDGGRVLGLNEEIA